LAPPGQSATQRPPAQTSSAAQALPHAPQLPESELVSTHAPSQRAKPWLQIELHVPFRQVAVPFAGASHTTSHAPQLAPSLETSTHPEPHAR
jgi:hypothetical protein